MQGIYAIVNTRTGRRYIGSSVDILRRWADHVRCFKRGRHVNRSLQRTWNAYGSRVFQLVTIEEVIRFEDLLCREQFHIDSSSNLYNVALTAGRPLSTKGTKSSEATRAKLRAAWKTRAPVSAETRAKVSAALKARYHGQPMPQMSADTIAKMAATKTGRKTGPHSAAWTAKIRLANTGKSVSPATRDKLRTANVGKKASAETRAKMSVSQRKRTQPPEAREKIRAAITAWWASRRDAVETVN